MAYMEMLMPGHPSVRVNTHGRKLRHMQMMIRSPWYSAHLRKERTIVCTDVLDDYFDKEYTLTDENWSGEITLEPQETRIYYFSADRVGDYLVEQNRNVSFGTMMNHNVEFQDVFWMLNDTSYRGLLRRLQSKTE